MKHDESAVAPDVMGLRTQYVAPGLVESDLASCPLRQFAEWFTDAASAAVPEPNAMTLATCGPAGPSARVVLAKGVDADGVRFFTNLRSAKAADIAADPRVALVFSWIPLHRQIRFTGVAELLGRAECAQYFATRPRGAQLGAWASKQSTPIRSRDELAARVADMEGRFPDGEPVPLPDHWGGYLVRPTAVEFWQGQPSRLHDRIRWTSVAGTPPLDRSSAWRWERLSP